MPNISTHTLTATQEVMTGWMTGWLTDWLALSVYVCMPVCLPACLPEKTLLPGRNRRARPKGAKN